MQQALYSTIIINLVLCFSCNAFAQFTIPKHQFTRQDTLRGGYGEGRTGWDVLKYDISIQPNFSTHEIKGKNKITFRETATKIMQIDMQEPMMIDSVIYKNKPLPLTREGNVYWVTYQSETAAHSASTTKREITVYFHGKPTEARNAPWNGGWIWSKDEQGRPWVSVACQGLGASIWYPCKDHQSDEPDDGASITMTVPDNLVAVSNGRLAATQKNKDGTTTWTWEVKNPINNYNIVPYIGKYVHFGETIQAAKGPLDLNYWVLDYNLEKAKKQFGAVPQMIHCFENWMGPYPFYEDSYKLIDAPHLGMEHQSGIAYGNHYGMGYFGSDLSGSGWGLRFDFIIIHESGHEWFGNNITAKDIADMWVHESFTNYSETLFTECVFGKQAGSDYVIGSRKKIANDIPVIGIYGVNKEGSGDMYYKGANMLHTIRQVIDDDTIFKNILQGLNKDFYHTTVTGKEIENYFSKKSGKDLSKIFDQYLLTTNVPELQYKAGKNNIAYRWAHVVSGFNMPIKLTNGQWIYPTTEFKKMRGKVASSGQIQVVPDFYVTVKEI